MKRLSITCILLAFVFTGFAQYDISEYFADTVVQIDNPEAEKSPETPKKLDFNVETGMSFSTFPGNGNILTNYIQPQWTYHFAPRFNLNFGTALIRQSYTGLPDYYSLNDNHTLSGNFNTAMVYAEGEYKVSKRITVSGMGYKEIPLSPRQPAYNPYLFNYLNQGMSMEIDYRITDNMRIGAAINISEGASPYSPMYNNYMSPFGGGPAYRGLMNPW